MKIRPIDTGNVLWNTIAPVMLPSASVSLPWRTQMTELNFSGSSVASGLRISETSSGSSPSVALTCCTWPTKKRAPMMMPSVATTPAG